MVGGLALGFGVYISLRVVSVGPQPCTLAAENVELNWANLSTTKTDVCMYSIQIEADCVLLFQDGEMVALLKSSRRQKARAVPGSIQGHGEAEPTSPPSRQ